MSNDLNSKINAVEREIVLLAEEIERKETKLDNTRDAVHRDFLMKWILRLQDEKKQLLDLEKQLRDEKNRPDNLVLERLKERNLKEANRQSKSYLYLCAKACWCDHSQISHCSD